MSAEQWAAVDDYLAQKLVDEDHALRTARESSSDTLYPGIDVTPTMGGFLALLVQITGAVRILEIGTLAGYSALWMARAAGPGARVITCELEERNADIAQENIDRAGLGEQIQILRGPAAETMQSLISQGAEPFDLIFIDADKKSNPDYLDAALQLSRPGSVLVIDNTVRGGAVIDASSHDPDIIGTRRLMDRIASDSRLTATALQTVGSKGWDGFTLLRRT
ncbi:O-methyltransferase [Nesterenkonia sphaerica]|uniref:O-methyltransferase n=1 Tax=Nesterenkonia sphaerica TaxID=1804988 RepID=A0A5R9A6E6_9MICC|nr:O-methyltransferase [Nesterenkonia sphaerica]TLP74178.1 O-methyltransferase [Nesterenkonia sphaerica]